jgi:signal peptidase II
MTPMRNWLCFGALAVAGAAADLISKSLAFRHIAPNDRDVVIIDGFFELGRTYNRGIVFGLAPGWSKAFLLISILAVPAIILIYASLKKPKWVMTVSLGLILGGTIGNMYDRVIDGAVRDFIKFYWAPGKAWPMFNIADSCICVGVALLSLEMLFFDEKKKKKGPEPAPQLPDAAPAPSGPTEPMPRADAPADANATNPLPTNPPDPA